MQRDDYSARTLKINNTVNGYAVIMPDIRVLLSVL